MVRILTVFLLACLTLPGLAGAAVETAQSRNAGRCPEGHPESGDLGIEYLLCVGGSCWVNMRRERGYAHYFSVEPRIRAIRPRSPAAGKLLDGDLLIAIDGVLITTREGGRRLANLTPGVPVTLRIRRNGREMHVTVVPELSCNMPRLAVVDAAGAAAAAHAQAAWAALEPPPTAPPVDFGMELECGECGWFATSSGPRWRSRAFPLVCSVEPDGPADHAGVQPGDLLLKLDGKFLSPMLDVDTLTPGQPVTLQVRRGEELLGLEITPRAPQREITPF